ncbi:MAG: 16S rRNA (guanine(966)-N(2))-methyltransferase RsmD [Gammaproteobacteria bacterium]
MATRKNSNSVRIIAGDWRGRRIPIPAGTRVRPTPDRVRETLFNWLNAVIPGARCLDLFAGTGVLGLEALSREAGEVWFVETDSSLIDSLRTQIARFEVEANVIHEAVSTVLDWPASQQFDIVFLDPPYELPLEPLLAKLSPWLAPGARVYVERRQTANAGGGLDGLTAALPGTVLAKQGRAGGVCYGLLALEE